MDKKKLAAAIAAVFTYIQTSKKLKEYHDTKDQQLTKLATVLGQLYETCGITGKVAQYEAHSIIQKLLFD